MDGFRQTDRKFILSYLTEDVRWLVPGVFDVRGKEAFAAHIVDEGFTGSPEITVSRSVEAGDVGVAEGSGACTVYGWHGDEPGLLRRLRAA
ncbi:MAG TPA: nuclear transport factor 2 family protein [Thermoanaerobaculia bacterium]|jgi:ketosteroid isomerase-like protein|nr:nuclear transport factor 2 family protein [Thermoanaerobaculia bacterium]